MLYGKSSLNVEIRNNSVLIEPTPIPALEKDVYAIRSAWQHPIDSEPLIDSVQPHQTVEIVISDITRPTPNHVLVPIIIEALDHVPLENIVIINGTGTHRDQTRDELIQMLGEDIVNHVRIVHNHCNDKETLK